MYGHLGIIITYLGNKAVAAVHNIAEYSGNLPRVARIGSYIKVLVFHSFR